MTTLTRIDKLSKDQEARLDEWADKWIDIGLKTGAADRAKFETAVRDCYQYANLDFPDVVVWVPSPLVLAFAAPAAALAIETIERLHKDPRDAVDGAVGGAVRGAVRDAVGGAVRDAVDGAVDGAVGGAVDGAVDDAVDGAVGGAVDGAVGGAVRGAVRDAVGGAVRGAVRGAVDGAVGGAVRGAVRDAVGGAVRDAVDGAVGGAVRGAVDGAVGGAVRGAVDDAVDGAVGGAVDGAVRDAVDGAVGGAVDDAVRGAVDGAVGDAIRRSWHKIIGGQFWVGGWWGSPAFTSFFREICGLELGEIWDRGRAYEATSESVSWWWPHRRFVMACEHPTHIHRELASEANPRGWGSHRLHSDQGPAVVWPDGWGVWSVHGIRVPRRVVEAPETLTVEEILGEENAEVRRVMIERFGAEHLLEGAGAKVLDEVHEPQFPGLLDAKLYRLDLPDDEPMVMVKCRNSSPEPDGSFKDYWLRVDPACRTAHEALAWTWGMDTSEYVPVVET